VQITDSADSVRRELILNSLYSKNTMNYLGKEGTKEQEETEIHQSEFIRKFSKEGTNYYS
jgi:hypothetical protein